MTCCRAFLIGIMLGLFAMGLSGGTYQRSSRTCSAPSDDGIIQPIEEKFEGGVKIYEQDNSVIYPCGKLRWER